MRRHNLQLRVQLLATVYGDPANDAHHRGLPVIATTNPTAPPRPLLSAS